MKSRTKKIAIVLLIILSVLGGGSYFVFGRKPAVEYTTAKAEIGNLVQTVSETGTVKTAKEISLNFLSNGKIAKQNVKIGDRVAKDQVLAELDYSNLQIQEKQSAASLQSALASLAKTVNGATTQDIAINQATASQAEVAYQNSLIDLENTKKTTAEAIAQAQKSLNDLLSGTGSSLTSQKQAVTSAETNLTNIQNTFQQSVTNKRNSLLTTLTDKLSVAKTALDSVNRVLTDNNLKSTLSIQDPTQLTNANSNYAAATDAVAKANDSLSKANANVTDNNVTTATNDTLDSLTKTLSALNFTFSALEKSVASAAFTQSQLDTFKSTISTQLTTLNTAISTVQTAQQSLNDSVLALNTNTNNAQRSLEQAQVAYNNAILTAKNNLTNTQLSADQQITNAKARVDTNFNNWQVARAQLEKTAAAPRNEDIKLAQAQVMQAQAALDSVKNQINNSIIRSPITGQVTQVNYEIGETPNATKPVIAVLTEDNYEIEVDISEADIAKLRESNQASITFDALGDGVKFTGDVIFIEPAQTIIQDVVYYKTTIGNVKFASAESSVSQLDQEASSTPAGVVLAATSTQIIPSATSTGSSTITALATSTATSTISYTDPYLSKVRPGMTANVIITAAAKNNVLIVPNRSIIQKTDGGLVIRILQNNKPVEMPVQIGLKGDEGMTEIVSGIKAGDSVITATKSANK